MPEKRRSGIQSVKNRKTQTVYYLRSQAWHSEVIWLGYDTVWACWWIPLSNSDVSASLKTNDNCVKELEIVRTLHVRDLF